MDWESLPFDQESLEEYLSSLYRSSVEVTAIRELGADRGSDTLKEYGYGAPLLVSFTHERSQERAVLHTMSGDGFGHERRSDRAGNLLLEHDTFNALPRHVRSLDVGAFTRKGSLLSLGRTDEFFLITSYATGVPYAKDLHRIADAGRLAPCDEERVVALAAYLAEIHAAKKLEPMLYQRRIRDLLGHGEGIMGILDSYPHDFSLAPPERLAAIEHECGTWRWRIKGLSHRLSQVHGDFHPWNVLFQEDNDFVLLDRSRGEWGEPADDASAMTINYILFSLRQGEALTEPFRRLYDLFWDHYLEATRDQELLDIIQPFYAWRALVVASPVWYPSLPLSAREALFRFIERVLAENHFDPMRIDEYIG